MSHVWKIDNLQGQFWERNGYIWATVVVFGEADVELSKAGNYASDMRIIYAEETELTF